MHQLYQLLWLSFLTLEKKYEGVEDYPYLITPLQGAFDGIPQDFAEQHSNTSKLLEGCGLLQFQSCSRNQMDFLFAVELEEQASQDVEELEQQLVLDQ